MITVATLPDLPVIYRLFEEAIEFQRNNNYIGWKNFDKAFLAQDVNAGLLYKIVNDEKIIGIFSICFTDPLIWREKEKGEALYLHRIVANRQLIKEPVFKIVLNWARNFAPERSRRLIRMDTWAGNKKIIGYYMSYGFSFVEDYTTPDTNDLPVQHRNLHVALLELVL